MKFILKAKNMYAMFNKLAQAIEDGTISCYEDIETLLDVNYPAAKRILHDFRHELEKFDIMVNYDNKKKLFYYSKPIHYSINCLETCELKIIL